VSGRRELIERAAAAFRRRFGGDPRWAAVAPGRVNLIGEHVDYQGGSVLPMAIDRWAAVVAGPAGGGGSVLHALDLDETARADLSGPLRPGGGFADYLLGVAAELGPCPNLDVVVAGTVPAGAGLSSSAAVEVAFAHVLLAAGGRSRDPVDLARLCRRAEHAFPGTPCGLMDQLAATCSRPGHALLIDCRSLAMVHVPVPDRLAVVIVDTGIRRALADGRFAEVLRRAEAAAAALGVACLREADLEAASRLDGPLRSVAEHVITEQERTLLAAAALKTGDLDALGALLLAAHASARDRLAVSCPELDAVVEHAAALRNEGVYGARLTGAGFGGCAVVLCEREAATAVTDAIRSRFAATFNRHPVTWLVRAAGPAALVQRRQSRDLTS